MMARHAVRADKKLSLLVGNGTSVISDTARLDATQARQRPAKALEA
jgi:hypothetical protein